MENGMKNGETAGAASEAQERSNMNAATGESETSAVPPQISQDDTEGTERPPSLTSNSSSSASGLSTQSSRLNSSSEDVMPVASTSRTVGPCVAPHNFPEARRCIQHHHCMSTVHVGCELKLMDILAKTRLSEYNPQICSGIILKIREPQATALVYKSGKITFSGPKNEEVARRAAMVFIRIIQKCGYPAQFGDFRIRHHTATTDIKMPIDIEGLAAAATDYVRYDPVVSSAIVWRLEQPAGVVVKIYSSGKLIFNGVKTRDQALEAFDTVHPNLQVHLLHH